MAQSFLLREFKVNDKVVSFQERQGTGGGGGRWEKCTLQGRSLKFSISQKSGLVKIQWFTHTFSSNLIQERELVGKTPRIFSFGWYYFLDVS